MGTFLCDFGLKHVLQVLNFVICTRKWYRVDKIILMFYTTIVHIDMVVGTKFYGFGPIRGNIKR